MPPTHACEAVVRPRFDTALGSFAAGRAFVLRLGDRELLITCQHLFGPAGGFFLELLPSRAVAEHVCGVSPTTLREQAPLPVEVTRVLVNDRARGDEPSADVCAFILDAPAPAALVPSTREPELGDLAWLCSPLRGAGPEDPALQLGMVFARHDGLLTVELEEPVALWGCSGAPIVDGTVVLHATGRGFTALELVYQMSNAVAVALEEHDWDLFDHCFFEGLHRCGTHVATTAMPAYCILFGS